MSFRIFPTEYLTQVFLRVLSSRLHKNGESRCHSQVQGITFYFSADIARESRDANRESPVCAGRGPFMSQRSEGGDALTQLANYQTRPPGRNRERAKRNERY